MVKYFSYLFFVLFFLFSVSGVFAESQLQICTIDQNTCDTNTNVNSNSTDSNFTIANGESLTRFYFFYSTGCPHCENVEEYMTELQKEMDFNVVSINIKESLENTNLFKDILSDFKVMGSGVPVVVINNHLYLGDTDIIANLKNDIEECNSKGGCELYVPNSKKQESAANIFTVTALAFADSINPCEIAVLLILLSAILLKQNKRKVLEYGLAFIVTIFLVYFFMGIALIFGMKAIDLSIGTHILFWVFGILALVLGFLNLKDALSYGAGGFVMEVPRVWRPTMKYLLQSVNSIWSAIIIAAIISVFLLPCTAGPYFLVSGILFSLPWSTILGWLVYYNIIFVLPMILILIVVYLGFAKVDALQRTREKNIKNLHLVASLLLIALGIYLLVMAV